MYIDEHGSVRQTPRMGDPALDEHGFMLRYPAWRTPQELENANGTIRSLTECLGVWQASSESWQKSAARWQNQYGDFSDPREDALRRRYAARKRLHPLVRLLMRPL